jgi:glucose-6-phosphate 1-epimerase
MSHRLSADYLASQGIQLHTTPNGLPILRIKNVAMQAELSLYGAQLLSFKPLETDTDILYLSPQAVFQHGKAIRGGIPICWPWFGADPAGLGRPAHGFARISLWELVSAERLADGVTQVVLQLSDSTETRVLWNHAFKVALMLTFAEELTLALTTTNLDTKAFSLTQALHTYFQVGDIAQTHIQGLNGVHYVDKAKQAIQQSQIQQGALTIQGEVDRVYTACPEVIYLTDSNLLREIRIHGSGSQSTVVWNPGQVISQQMVDLPDNAYQQFVCIETCNAGQDVITLAPQANHTLSATYRLVQL